MPEKRDLRDLIFLYYHRLWILSIMQKPLLLTGAFKMAFGFYILRSDGSLAILLDSPVHWG